MATREDRISHRINRIQAPLYVTAAAIVILFSALVYGIHQNQTAISQGHTAICGIKVQLEHHIKSTKDFLLTNPQGIPGVPKKLLLQGLNEDENQLKALKSISCS